MWGRIRDVPAPNFPSTPPAPQTVRCLETRILAAPLTAMQIRIMINANLTASFTPGKIQDARVQKFLYMLIVLKIANCSRDRILDVPAPKIQHISTVLLTVDSLGTKTQDVKTFVQKIQLIPVVRE